MLFDSMIVKEEIKGVSVRVVVVNMNFLKRKENYFSVIIIV